MSDVSHPPARGSLGLTVVAVILGFLLFVGILVVWYLPERGVEDDGLPVWSATELKQIEELPAEERAARQVQMRWDRRTPLPADRKARLDDLRAQESSALSSYGWIDQGSGVVRLPIDRAMELTLQDLQRQRGAR